ncbi:MAG: hypothetical protein QNK30_02840 [Bacteroidales bacterium]|nr:hypothetical protein [Bacteroidales bacterium]
MDIIKLNQIGAYTAIFILLTSSLIFIFRLLNQHSAEYWTGIAFMITAIPLIYLLFNAAQFQRPTLYFVQIGLMICFIIIELLLDYILKFDFRHTKWMAISYAMFFFASTGGMIGLASQAGKPWTIISIILFFIMTGLAFYQRAKTGM